MTRELLNFACAPIFRFNRIPLSLLLSGFILLFTTAEAQRTVIQSHKNGYFIDGQELMLKGKYAAARQAFEEYLKNDDHSLTAVDARYHIIIAALNLYHEDAELLAEEFITSFSEHPKALTLYLELGHFYYREKAYKKAITYYEKVDITSLDYKEGTKRDFHLGYAYFSQKLFDKALPLFNKTKKGNNKYSYASYYYAGFIAYNKKDYKSAIKDLKQAERNKQYGVVVPFMIANIYYKQKKYEQLISYVNQVFDNKTQVRNKKELNILLADSYYYIKDYKRALAVYNSYTQNKKAKVPLDLSYRIGFANFLEGDLDVAIRYLKKASISQDTISQYASYNLGLLYLKQGNNVFALPAFDKARKKKYNKEIQELASFKYAKVSFDDGKYENAIEAFKSFINTYPNSEHIPEANSLVSDAYLNTNNHDHAIAYIEGLSEKNERIKATYQKVTYYRGVELYNKKEFYDAVMMFKKSISNPNDKSFVIDAYFWMGEAYSIGRRHKEAINAYGAIYQIDDHKKSPNYLKSRYAIGYAYYNTKAYEKALSHFKAYIEESDSKKRRLKYLPDAKVRLADCYYVTKYYNSAIRYYDEVLAFTHSYDDYCHLQKGIVFNLMSKYKDAQKSFTTVVEQYTKSPYVDDALYYLALLDFEQGNYNPALLGFTKLLTAVTHSTYIPYALQKRAIAYYNLNQLEKAEKDYINLLDHYTTHVLAHDALLGLQEVLNHQDKSEELTTYLEKYKLANPDSKNLEIVEFEAAKGLYFNQKYNEAVNTFTAYINNYPETSYAFDARFYIAESYYRLQENQKALDTYVKVLQENRVGIKSYNKTLLRIADINIDLANYEVAIKHYNLLGSFSRNRKEQYLSRAGLMEAYFMKPQYDSCVFYARMILEEENLKFDAKNTANLYLGKSTYAKGMYEESIDYFIECLNTAKDEIGAEAQYLMAEVFYRQNNYNQSLETLYDLNKNFAIYDVWLGKSFLLIADNFIAMEELLQAEATLNSVIEHSPNDEVVNAAKEKLTIVKEKEVKIEKESNQDTVEIDIDETVEDINDSIEYLPEDE